MTDIVTTIRPVFLQLAISAGSRLHHGGRSKCQKFFDWWWCCETRINSVAFCAVLDRVEDYLTEYMQIYCWRPGKQHKGRRPSIMSLALLSLYRPRNCKVAPAEKEQEQEIEAEEHGPVQTLPPVTCHPSCVMVCCVN